MTTTETEDSGVLSPGHHDKEASQNTLSTEQYKDAKEQKSIAAFPLSKDFSTEKGQGSINLSTLHDTGNGHQEDSTIPPSTQEKSPACSVPLNSLKAGEDTRVPILSQNASGKQQNISTPSPTHNEGMENSTGPSSPSQDMTISLAGESRTTTPVATRDMSKLSLAQRKFVNEFLVQCNKIYQEAETEKVGFTFINFYVFSTDGGYRENFIFIQIFFY